LAQKRSETRRLRAAAGPRSREQVCIAQSMQNGGIRMLLRAIVHATAKQQDGRAPSP
jgi:hypothetical protein